MTRPWNAARAASRRPLRKTIVFAKPVGDDANNLVQAGFARGNRCGKLAGGDFTPECGHVMCQSDCRVPKPSTCSLCKTNPGTDHLVRSGRFGVCEDCHRLGPPCVTEGCSGRAPSAGQKCEPCRKPTAAPFAVGDRVWHVGLGPLVIGVFDGTKCELLVVRFPADIGLQYCGLENLRRAGDTEWLRALPPETRVKRNQCNGVWCPECAQTSLEMINNAKAGSCDHWIYVDKTDWELAGGAK